MRLFDTHCHLDFEAFDADRAEVVERARGAGVDALLVPGYAPRTWARAAALARAIPGARVAVGLHPLALSEPRPAPALEPARVPRAALDEPAPDLDPEHLEEALYAAARAHGAVAIGECGLDARPGLAPLERQRLILDAQLRVARALCLPVVLHCVRAHGALLDCLERGGPLPAGGALHAFTGPAELLPRYGRLGLSFGLGGALTRPAARRPQEAARAVPLDRLLLETDSPDMAPEGAPGPRNEPAFLKYTLAALAALRGVPEEELAAAAYDNALRLFGPPPLPSPPSSPSPPAPPPIA